MWPRTKLKFKRLTSISLFYITLCSLHWIPVKICLRFDINYQDSEALKGLHTRHQYWMFSIIEFSRSWNIFKDEKISFRICVNLWLKTEQSKKVWATSKMIFLHWKLNKILRMMRIWSLFLFVLTRGPTSLHWKYSTNWDSLTRKKQHKHSSTHIRRHSLKLCTDAIELKELALLWQRRVVIKSCLDIVNHGRAAPRHTTTAFAATSKPTSSLLSVTSILGCALYTFIPTLAPFTNISPLFFSIIAFHLCISQNLKIFKV